jgi:hypothetical protein
MSLADSPALPWLRVDAGSAARLTRLFVEGFSATDIAEDLCSFDAERPAGEVRAVMEAHRFDLAGIRRDGFVAGYAIGAELEGGTCGDYLHPFEPDDLVAGTAPLAATIRSLDVNGRCFVSVLDRVSAIVTFTDLEKAPVRMWLFGMITILEMRLTDAIRQRIPEPEWLSMLSPERRAATEALRAERRRIGHDVGLLECLQLGDKSRILLRAGAPFRHRFASGREAKGFFKDVQQLRNNLAHAQQFVATDWRVVVGLAAALDAIVGGA